MTESTTAMTAEPKPVPPNTFSESDRARARNIRKMITQANRIWLLPSGERLFVRFGQAEILEHWVLLISFLVLAFTGLLDMFALSNLPASLIAWIFHDIDGVRSIHNMAAWVYAALTLVHIVRVLGNWFVKGDSASLLPSPRDFKDIGGSLKYLLSRNAPRPESGRYTTDQKLTYWALAGFSAILLLTALVMWLQTPVMQFLPGAFLPIVRSLHGLIGLLAVVTLLPWHIYNTVVKEWNTSIFTGLIQEKTIRHNHPLEYRQIMAAFEAYQSFKTVNSQVAAQAENDQPQASEGHPANGEGTSGVILRNDATAGEKPADEDKAPPS